METFNLDGIFINLPHRHASSGKASPQAPPPIGASKELVKAWLKNKNTAAQNLKVARALIDGAFPDVPIPENSAALLAKLSSEVLMADAGLKECRRRRQLVLSKNKRDVAKANAHRFRAAALVATFAAVNGASEDDGAGEGEAPPSLKKRKLESESESEEGHEAGDA